MISELKEDLIGIKHRQNSTEEILREMKEVVSTQHKTILEIVKMQEKQQSFDREVLQLRQDFENRTAATEPVMAEFRVTMGKINGMMVAAIFFLSLIQAGVTYVWNSNNSNINARFDRIEKSIDEKRSMK